MPALSPAFQRGVRCAIASPHHESRRSFSWISDEERRGSIFQRLFLRARHMHYLGAAPSRACVMQPDLATVRRPPAGFPASAAEK
jgi:hypothetical protein